MRKSQPPFDYRSRLNPTEWPGSLPCASLFLHGLPAQESQQSRQDHSQDDQDKEHHPQRPALVRIGHAFHGEKDQVEKKICADGANGPPGRSCISSSG